MALPKMPVKKSAVKQFTLQPWTNQGQGHKVILYGDSGIGKTTLASLASNPAFIGIDDGGRMILHPVTGQPLVSVPDVTTFQDVRDVLHSNVFDDCNTIVIDNVTELERLALPYVFEHIKKQGGQTAVNIEDYGFHKGYRYWYETMLLILSDCDRWVRKGKNIVMIAQATSVKIANPAGEDFLKQAPELFHDKNVSSLNAYVSWADHVLRMSYSHVEVTNGKAGSTNERAVFVHPEIHFYAKSRTISADYPVVTFNKPSDASIWRLMFGGNYDATRNDAIDTR